MELICTKELVTKHLIFREGETYSGCLINDAWWIIDAVGIKTEDVEKHFENKNN